MVSSNMNIKNLLVMRHAHAPNIHSSDWERNLSDEGMLQAKKAAEFLKSSFKVDKILCSLALRTNQTLEIVQERLNVQLVDIKLEFYKATELEWLSDIKAQGDEINNLLIIGHNPTLSHLIKILTDNNKAKEEFSGILAPAEIAVIRFNSQSWQNLTKESKTLERIFKPT